MPEKVDSESEMEIDPSVSDYRYCPLCATTLQTTIREDRLRAHCPACGWVHYRNPTTGVAVILQYQGAVLLGKRRSGDWCIPCGHVEWGESIQQAAIREAKEELNLQVRLQALYDVHSNFHKPDQLTVGVWFLAECHDLSPARAGGDLIELAWFPPSQAPPLAFPTDQLVLQRLEQEQARVK
jgi:8-oxo-dGTP diphosphatase